MDVNVKYDRLKIKIDVWMYRKNNYKILVL